LIVYRGRKAYLYNYNVAVSWWSFFLPKPNKKYQRRRSEIKANWKPAYVLEFV